MIIVAVVALSGIFELHLHEIRDFVVAGYVAHVVKRIELMLGASASAGSKASKTGVGDDFFRHINMVSPRGVAAIEGKSFCCRACRKKRWQVDILYRLQK